MKAWGVLESSKGGEVKHLKTEWGDRNEFRPKSNERR